MTISFTTTKTALLHDFPELDLYHTGNYTCEASNYNITTKKRSILVTVTCKHLLLTRFFHTCSL